MGKEPRIMVEMNALIDKDEFGNPITKKEYLNLFTDVNIKFKLFKKENIGISVMFLFSRVDSQFSIYDVQSLDQTERNICQNFLNLLNVMAEHHLKDI